MRKDNALFSCLVVSGSLQPHGLQHSRLPSLSLSSTVGSNSFIQRYCIGDIYLTHIRFFVFFFFYFLEKSDCLLIANEEENICLTLALLILNFPSFVLDNHLCANVTIIKVSKEVNIQLLCKKSQRASCLVLSSYLFAIVRDKPLKF